MIRFLFLLLIIFSSCSKIDDLPIDKVEDNPIFTVDINVDGEPFTFKAGIEDYFMFAQVDTVGSLRLNKGVLAPKSEDMPILQSALSINFIGQDVKSGILSLPQIGSVELFNNDTIPYWDLSLQASLFGELSGAGLKILIDDEEFDYSSQTKYVVRQKDSNKVKLTKSIEDKNYYYSVTKLKGELESLGQENLHIFLEGENEVNSKIFVQSNFGNFTTAIIFPDGNVYDFIESIMVDQLGEYKVVATHNATNTKIETNFYIEKNQAGIWRSSRINFTGRTLYLGMIKAVNSAFIEYYNSDGKLFTSISSEAQPASSYFRIEKIEAFQPNSHNLTTDKVTFTGEVVLTSSDNERVVFSGSGVIALGR